MKPRRLRWETEHAARLRACQHLTRLTFFLSLGLGLTRAIPPWPWPWSRPHAPLGRIPRSLSSAQTWPSPCAPCSLPSCWRCWRRLRSPRPPLARAAAAWPRAGPISAIARASAATRTDAATPASAVATSAPEIVKLASCARCRVKTRRLVIHVPHRLLSTKSVLLLSRAQAIAFRVRAWCAFCESARCVIAASIRGTSRRSLPVG